MEIAELRTQSSKTTIRIMALSILGLIAAMFRAQAAEFPAGDVIHVNGMEITAVYLQAVEMAPHVDGQEGASADIHLEADVQAAADHPHGLEAGAWVPYLKITYTLKKKGSDWQASGTLLPMVANDGPHYGANIKLDGPGAYEVTYLIEPPSANGFLRHTDAETSVPEWWEPFVYHGSFKFIGVGKKGGY